MSKPSKAQIALARRLEEAGIEFEQQCIIGYYIVDFVMPKKMLILELDYEGCRQSIRRDRYLRGLGFKVIRIPSEKVEICRIRWIKHRADRRGQEFDKAIGQARAEKERIEREQQEREEIKRLGSWKPPGRAPRLIKRATQ